MTPAPGPDAAPRSGTPGDGPLDPPPHVPVAPHGPVAPLARWLRPAYASLGAPVRGSAGVVFRARDRATGRVVALKVAGAPALRAELDREARLADVVRHPRVLDVRALRGPRGALALASPWAAGGTLRAALAAARADSGPDARAPLGYARTAAVLRDVAAALAHVHRAGVTHADVKPENIFLDADGGRALLGDFGIAHRAGWEAPTAHGSAGTPAYMAPEQVDGAAIDARTDVYALGLVGWELLAGRRPWDGRALADVLRAQRSEPLPSLAELCPDVPAYLLAAVEGALAKHPAARWADGAAMLARLTPTPAALPAVSTPCAPAVDRAAVDAATVRFGASPQAAAASRRLRAVRSGGLLAAAAVVGFAVAGGARDDDARAPAAASGRTVRPERVSLGRGPLPSAPFAVSPHDTAPLTTPTHRSAPALHARPRSVPRSSRPARAGGPCSTPTDAAQRACAAAGAARAERRVAAAVESLAAAIRGAAPDGWEPAALAQLRAEQARWRAASARECLSDSAAPASGWGSARGACLAGRAERRTAALAARRARFSPSAGGGGRER